MSVIKAAPNSSEELDKSSNGRLASLLRHVTVAGRGSRQTHQDRQDAAMHPRSNCLFCQRHDRRLNQIMCENETFFARYDNFPATTGHIEIIPKRHVESLFDLSPLEMTQAYELMSRAQKILANQYHPDGYTIGVNEGKAAGRSIDHLHIHLIPRRFGDVDDPRGGIRQVLPNYDPDSWK